MYLLKGKPVSNHDSSLHSYTTTLFKLKTLTILIITTIPKFIIEVQYL